MPDDERKPGLRVEDVITAVVVVVAVLIAVILVIIFSSRGAKAGTEYAWKIQAPPGARVEINTPAALRSERVDGIFYVYVASADTNAKAKARWQLGKASCYADGYIGKVLTDIERCANANVGQWGGVK